MTCGLGWANICIFNIPKNNNNIFEGHFPQFLF